jgi:hypothetical protein
MHTLPSRWVQEPLEEELGRRGCCNGKALAEGCGPGTAAFVINVAGAADRYVRSYQGRYWRRNWAPVVAARSRMLAAGCGPATDALDGHGSYTPTGCWLLF